MIAKLALDGIETSVILDTGAGISVIGGLFYDTHLAGDNRSIRPWTGPDALAANNMVMKIRGAAHIPYRIGSRTGTHAFRIIDDLRNTVIIGTDLLNEWDAIIDFKAGLVRMQYFEAVPFTVFRDNTAETQVGTIRMAEDVTVPPLSVCHVPVIMKVKRDGIFDALMPGDLVKKRGVTMRNGTVEYRNGQGTTLAQVVNYSDAPVKLRTNMKVGLVFDSQIEEQNLWTIKMMVQPEVDAGIVEIPPEVQSIICKKIAATDDADFIMTCATVCKRWRKDLLSDRWKYEVRPKRKYYGHDGCYDYSGSESADAWEYQFYHLVEQHRISLKSIFGTGLKLGIEEHPADPLIVRLAQDGIYYLTPPELKRFVNTHEEPWNQRNRKGRDPYDWAVRIYFRQQHWLQYFRNKRGIIRMQPWEPNFSVQEYNVDDLDIRYLPYSGISLPECIPTMPIVVQRILADWIVTELVGPLTETCAGINKMWRNIVYQKYTALLKLNEVRGGKVTSCGYSGRWWEDKSISYPSWYGYKGNYHIPYTQSCGYTEVDYWLNDESKREPLDVLSDLTDEMKVLLRTRGIFELSSGEAYDLRQCCDYVYTHPEVWIDRLKARQSWVNGYRGRHGIKRQRGDFDVPYPINHDPEPEEWIEENLDVIQALKVVNQILAEQSTATWSSTDQRKHDYPPSDDVEMYSTGESRNKYPKFYERPNSEHALRLSNRFDDDSQRRIDVQNSRIGAQNERIAALQSSVQPTDWRHFDDLNNSNLDRKQALVNPDQRSKIKRSVDRGSQDVRTNSIRSSDLRIHVMLEGKQRTVSKTVKRPRAPATTNDYDAIIKSIQEMDLETDTKLSKEQQCEVREFLTKNMTVFSTNPKGPGVTTAVKHHIDTALAPQ